MAGNIQGKAVYNDVIDEVYELEIKLTARERDLLGLPPKVPAGK